VEAVTARGINVVGVANGTAALVSLQRSRPHLVVANPSARGLRIRELSRMLAQSDEGIPLVLVGSQPSSVELRHAALIEGAFDYFELPLEFELLIERVQQLVALRQKIDRLRADADLDSLTGLANRRRFRVALVREVERWRRYRVPCALLMLLPYYAAPKGTATSRTTPEQAVSLVSALKLAFTHRRFLAVIVLFAGGQMSFTAMTAAAPFIAPRLGSPRRRKRAHASSREGSGDPAKLGLKARLNLLGARPVSGTRCLARTESSSVSVFVTPPMRTPPRARW
jgi:hypothetical protein